MKHSGENWVEKSPFNPQGHYLGERSESTSPSSETVPDTVSPEPVEPVKMEVQPEAAPEIVLPPVVVSMSVVEEKVPSQQPETPEVTPPSPEVVARKVKMARRRVVLHVPADDEKSEEERKENEVVLRRNRPIRSQTVCTRSPKLSGGGSGSSELRRKSLVMLQSGHTGEKGSRRFRAALKRDSIYEGHPGWESIRKLSVVVGRLQLLRKASMKSPTTEDRNVRLSLPPTQQDESTEICTKDKKNISESLLSMVGKNDNLQLRLVFNAIDKNKDGHLNRSELEEFATELGNSHSESMAAEVNTLLSKMDSDNDGTVSFAEFADYMATLALLAPEGVKQENNEDLPFPEPVSANS